jgi:hypothetical protein
MSKEEEMKAMDDAAALAKEELMRNIGEWGVKAAAVWWNKWYGKAGHKRLGRLLVELAKEN